MRLRAVCVDLRPRPQDPGDCLAVAHRTYDSYVQDFPHVEVLDRPLSGGYGHGGSRPGSGRKPQGYEKSDDLKNLDAAKARHESVKADLAELELRKRRSEVVEREAVRGAAAMALQTLAQALRSIPDALERELNLAPEVAEAVGRMIDSGLDDLADSFEMMTGPVPMGDDDVTDVDVR